MIDGPMIDGPMARWPDGPMIRCPDGVAYTLTRGMQERTTSATIVGQVGM
jgi:hypothetical protein